MRIAPTVSLSDEQRQTTSRVRLRTIHKWVGLTAGLLASLVGISGSLLLYREEIGRRVRNVPTSVTCTSPRLPLEDLLAGALHASAGATPLLLSLPPRDGALPEVLLLTTSGQLRLLAVNPCSGDVFGTLNGGGPTWVDGVARLHTSFALGRFGRWLVAAVALSLIFLALSGIRLFLRGPRPFHAWLGLASSLLLVVYAVSGVTFLFWRAPSPLRPVIVPTTSARASLDRLALSATGAVPGSTLSWIEFPATADSPFAARLCEPWDQRLRGSTTVYLDPATARVLRVDRWRDLSFGLRLYHVFAAVHFGEVGGVKMRWLWFVAGFLPLLLWLSAWPLRWRSSRRRL